MGYPTRKRGTCVKSPNKKPVGRGGNSALSPTGWGFRPHNMLTLTLRQHV